MRTHILHSTDSLSFIPVSNQPESEASTLIRGATNLVRMSFNLQLVTLPAKLSASSCRTC